jgi:DNA-directed RNA polymerase specialized sigma24 family protein
VIFVTDMERAIDKLTALDKKLLFMNVLEEYYIPDMARLLSCNERTVRRGLQNALDNLSELLLAGEMMGEIGCQEGKNYKRGVSRSKEGRNKVR